MDLSHLLHPKIHQKDYVKTGQPISYLDGEGLNRPAKFDSKQKAITIAFVAIAALIGIFMLVSFQTNVLGSAEKTKSQIEANISREVDLQLPKLSTLITKGDSKIQSWMKKKGYVTVQKKTTNKDDTMSVVKLPQDLSVDAGSALCEKGYGALNGVEASLLMNGSWTLTVNRESGVSMHLAYADFTSKSANEAINRAMKAEGFSKKTLLKDKGSGVDESGNTYKAGTFKNKDKTYSWRVSAIPLSDVYDISGLPESAIYVGIRVSKA